MNTKGTLETLQELLETLYKLFGTLWELLKNSQEHCIVGTFRNILYIQHYIHQRLFHTQTKPFPPIWKNYGNINYIIVLKSCLVLEEMDFFSIIWNLSSLTSTQFHFQMQQHLQSCTDCLENNLVIPFSIFSKGFLSVSECFWTIKLRFRKPYLFLLYALIQWFLIGYGHSFQKLTAI